MRVIVAGSQTFNNYEFIKNTLDVLLKGRGVTQIVCGMAKGVDLCGKRYAEERGLIVGEFPADWGKYGRSAGFIRNKEMANHATLAIVFWNGVSPGAKNMFETMQKMGKETELIMIPKELL